MKRKRNVICCAVAGWLVIAGVSRAEEAVGTAFTYQGFLEKPAGTPLNDTCAFELALCDDPTAACSPGTISNHPGIEVTDGVFTVPDVDFGAGSITGQARWMEVSVQCTGDAAPVALSPRVELKPAPYALALPGLYTQENATSPNVIGGFSGNTVSPGVGGATIGGGGGEDPLFFALPNTVEAEWGTVGGGAANTASGIQAVVGGGALNTASGLRAVVGGGFFNTASGVLSVVAGGRNHLAGEDFATIGGGTFNTASGIESTVGGGGDSTASGIWSTVGGGTTNTASGRKSTVGGGGFNTATGFGSTVPGGESNLAGGDYSFAAGQRAKVRDAATVGDTDGDQGTFVWADSTDADFLSTGADQFLIRAGGGVGINTNAPTEQLEVAGNAKVTGTIQSGSSITIDGTGGAEKIASTDALEIHTSTGRVLRVTPEAESIVFSGLFSPNILGGFQDNSITADVVGATIAGGGTTTSPNRVTDDWGTIGGGIANVAGDDAGTTSDAFNATVGGGQDNTASGAASTVGGGSSNTASGFSSTVGGGQSNTASGSTSTVGGGSSNTASGFVSTVAGGSANQAGGDFSFAAGRRAKVRDDDSGSPYYSGDSDGDEGTFAWADSTNADFVSTGPNQFLIRASGGVGIGTSNPLAELHVRPAGSASLGRLLVTPGTSNANSQVTLAENTSASGGSVMRFDGSVNQWQLWGLNTTEIGPHVVVGRDVGNVGIGTSTRSVDARLHVQADNARVAKIDRFDSDGDLLAWARDDGVVGNVTVSAGVVSYNAFTGSHYAWCEAAPQRGALMRMTGDNRVLPSGGEPIYGIAPTTGPNDPACLGAFVDTLPGEGFGTDRDIRLVAAVGNGELCVVDTGKDIAPGDLMISSHVPGCAMRDDPEAFPIGHVVARAAERVRWNDVQGGPDGLRRSTISVLYDSFTRGPVKTVETLEAENAELRMRLEALERTVGASSLMQAGAPIVLVGLVGLALLRRRNPKGSVR